MVAATLVWTAESGRLREPLEYLRNSSFPNSLKVRIFKSNVVSVLLYGSSSWKVSKPITTKLQVLVNRSLRRIFHIYWPNTISNMNLLKMADMQQIDVIIKRHKRGWIGHKLRKDESSVARKTMQWSPLDGIGRKKRRPCETWRQTVERQCKNVNKTWSDLKQLAQSRVRCRVGVVDPDWDQGNREEEIIVVNF